MYFQDFDSLIHMGGHGPFVWSAYAIGLLIIAYNVLSPLMARQRIVSQIKRQIRTQKQAGKSKEAPAPVSTEGRIIKSQQHLSIASKAE